MTTRLWCISTRFHWMTLMAVTMLAIHLVGTAAFFAMVGTIFIMLVAAGMLFSGVGNGSGGGGLVFGSKKSMAMNFTPVMPASAPRNFWRRCCRAASVRFEQMRGRSGAIGESTS